MDSPVCGKTKAQLKKEGHTEKGTQAFILEKLGLMESLGTCWFFRNNSFAGTFNRANGSSGFIRNSKPGSPDIICCFPRHIEGELVGQFIGIEVKGPSGSYQASQEPAHEAIRKVGGIVWTVYCPEDFDLLLTTI